MDYEDSRFTPERALQLLKLGNERRLSWLKKQAEDPERGVKFQEQRKKLIKGERPLAILISCSDSRFPPEIIFHNREGDIFVIRTAGHVIGSDAAGSIEYAVSHLKVPLIVVMGHDQCGAVQAAVDHAITPGHVINVIEHIYPAVQKVRGIGGNILSAAIDQHVKDTVARLRNLEPICRKFFEEGKLNIIGARCSIDSYEVKWL